MNYIITYDIASNKIRKKIAEILSEYGIRIQYSVFECKLTNRENDELKKELEELDISKNDSVILFPICKNCYEKKVIIGKPYNILNIQFVDI